VGDDALDGLHQAEHLDGRGNQVTGRSAVPETPRPPPAKRGQVTADALVQSR
jgi:hypothetical protein